MSEQMRLGLISDTHSPALGDEPPPEVTHAFRGVDMILHAGDIYSSECLDALERIAPVLAVEVPPAPAIGDDRVSFKRIVSVAGYEIGLVHDLTIDGLIGGEVIPGAIEARFRSEHSLSKVLHDFFDGPVDTVVHGHTHIPMVEEQDDILIINPGSPTLPRQIRKLGTVAILELGPGTRSAEIIDLRQL